MSNWIDPYEPNTSQEEQQIYQYLLGLVETESPNQMIERYRMLFIEGADYPDTTILAVLDKITNSKKAEHEFKFFLNRCCHILINRWHMKPQLHGAIPELIALFEKSPTRSRTHSFRYTAIRRMNELVKLFVHSEQYQSLCRLGRVMSQNSDIYSQNNHQPLVSLIRRYPYLYEHCLLSEDSIYEHKKTVKTIQEQVQKQFEIELSQYVTYQVRLVHISQTKPDLETERILRPIKNPTLLNNSELYATLKQFIGKVESGQTYEDLAHNFLQYSHHTRNFHTFKDELYQYLIPSIDLEYGKRQFNERLYRKIQNTLPEANFQKPSEFLVIRACSQLLNFLIVENSSLQHFTFIDLISNQGTVSTTGLLLKIVLICRKIKPYLEKRLALLFNHYESSTTDCIKWLVQILEQINIALSIHFGKIDLSYFKPLY